MSSFQLASSNIKLVIDCNEGSLRSWLLCTSSSSNLRTIFSCMRVVSQTEYGALAQLHRFSTCTIDPVVQVARAVDYETRRCASNQSAELSVSAVASSGSLASTVCASSEGIMLQLNRHYFCYYALQLNAEGVIHRESAPALVD